MNRIMVRTVTIWLLLLIAIPIRSTEADSLKTDIQLRTRLERNNVPLNREVVYHVELSWRGQLSRYHISNITEPVVSNLKLRGSGSSNRFYTDKEGNPRSVKRITYYFTPLAIGMAYIDGITIQYEDQLTNQKESLQAQRIGVKIVDAVPEADSTSDYVKRFLLGLIALFILIVIFFVFRYFRVRRQEQKDEQAMPTLEDKYLQKLRTDLDLNRDDSGEALAKLTRNFNHYLRDRFELPPGASSFDEIGRVCRQQGLPDDLLQKLEKLYQRAELSKFAGEAISASENQLYFDTIELVLKHFNNQDQSASTSPPDG